MYPAAPVAVGAEITCIEYPGGGVILCWDMVDLFKSYLEGLLRALFIESQSCLPVQVCEDQVICICRQDIENETAVVSSHVATFSPTLLVIK